MPDVTTIILDAMNALQALNNTICTAPVVSSYPTAIDTGSGPICITWPADGEVWQKGGGYDQGVLNMRVIVFIDPVAQNDIPSHAADGAVLLQKFLNLYVKVGNTPQAAPPPYQLTIQSGPASSHVHHGGLVPTLSFGGRAFVGFELTIPVRMEWIQS